MARDGVMGDTYPLKVPSILRWWCRWVVRVRITHDILCWFCDSPVFFPVAFSANLAPGADQARVWFWNVWLIFQIHSNMHCAHLPAIEYLGLSLATARRCAYPHLHWSAFRRACHIIKFDDTPQRARPTYATIFAYPWSSRSPRHHTVSCRLIATHY